ncbi:uncharacterized protein LOC135497700 [Lineus longissimus]|uniref:uncharacterized protein LOC135497700 n=1 Tax=Lineus longissimus TaxID=88925 RepID=UPI00315DB6A5
MPGPAGHYNALREFHNRVMGDIRSLENLNVDIYKCAPFIVPIIEKKLPKFFQEKMGNSGQHDAFDLKRFMQSFSEQLENVGERADAPRQSDISHRKSTQNQNRNLNGSKVSLDSFVSVPAAKPKMCQFCNSGHSCFECTLSPTNRYNAVFNKRLCSNRLRTSHIAKECNNRSKCHTCGKKHHTSLHEYFEQKYRNSNNTGMCAVTPKHSDVRKIDINDHVGFKTTNVNSKKRATNRPSTVLLETGYVTLQNKGKEATAGVLIDRGSMSSYIRKNTAQKLQLNPFLENRLVKGDGPTVQYSNLGCFVSGPLFPIKIEHSVITSADRINTTANEHIIEDNDPEIQSLEEFINSSTLQPTDENDTDFDEQFKSDFMQKIEFKNGNYSVPLPWRPDHAELLTNRRECEARLRQIMARLRKLTLLNNYTQVMQENLDKGFISEGSPDDCDTGHYLPHFPVLRDSETTPQRIVFDASNGSPSLNSCLYEGPNMLQDLTELIMLFRTKRIGLSADIARAFLAVHLLESERNPFALAITLHKHLSSYDTPVAKDMKTKFYVDNLLPGVDSNQEALDYFQESRAIMNHASFNLRQWSSNSETLDERIRSEGVQTKSDIVGVLGLKWDTKSDQISVAKKDLKSSGELSKRKVTSQTASIFDPLGIVAPLTVPAKSYVNNLWRGQKTWDEHLSITERQEWETIKQESLSLTHMLSIPRWLGGDTSKPLQIVVFCDACPTTAIGCVAYAKQNNKVALIGSKNKVISEKNVNFTVPKLELMAMVLGVNYAETLRNTYITQYQTIEVVYSTDSEIALYWLRSNKKHKQFVHNRVQTIRQKSDLTSWYRVSTKQNAADILSRDATHQELKDSSWLQGPKWLKDDKTTWPLTALSDLTLNSSVSLTAAFEMQNDFVVTSMVTTTPVASISDVIA